MITIFKKITVAMLLPVLLATMVSCNKDLEKPVAAAESGQSIGAVISTNPSYSIFYAAVTRAGLLPILNDTSNNITLFLPDDNAMTISGFPLTVVNAVPVTTLTSVLQYHIIGTKVPSSLFTGAFPNLRIPTSLALDPTNALVRMSTFPSKLTSFAYVNNTPVTAADQVFNNGIIHNVATVLAPPSATLKTMIAGDTAMVYFRAAVARADSGSVGLGKLDSLLNFGVTNMTVLTPNNAALRTVLFGAIYQGAYPSVYAVLYPLVYNGAIAGGATPAVADSIAKRRVADTTTARATAASSPAALASPAAGFNLLPVATVKGIVAYHFVATNSTGSYTPNIRVFSVNIPAVPTQVKTLVNGSFALHPGITAEATFTGPIATAVKFTGAANGGVAANVISKDKHAVNGVYHIIDRVLLPQ
jgi:uncharacterized surface protein with fasciclin (FAS1) repeats